jgi:hypothetical protein
MSIVVRRVQHITGARPLGAFAGFELLIGGVDGTINDRVDLPAPWQSPPDAWSTPTASAQRRAASFALAQAS